MLKTLAVETHATRSLTFTTTGHCRIGLRGSGTITRTIHSTYLDNFAGRN